MRRALDAALLLDKPLGITSNAALQHAKRLFGARKAGHAGTLDPLASGLLLVLFGEATKFAGPLLDSDKEYVATLRLGITTTTGDTEGAVLERKAVELPDEAIETVLKRFLGPITQVPPMHSALKRGGVPLYELARRGETVERAAREVLIRELQLLKREQDCVAVRVLCSKGTYVRTLGEDIGAALGTGAHLSALRRTTLGPFHVGQALSPEALATLPEPEREAVLLPLERLLEGLQRVELDASMAARFRNGQAVEAETGLAGLCAVFGTDRKVIGLGEAAGAWLKPRRLTAVPTQAADKAQ
jgi:tRNA pseudouridine55 synthase